MRISQLTQWDGEVNRRDYLLWGVILFAVKYNLDRVIGIFMGRNWFVWDYLFQADRLSVLEITDTDRTFYLILLCCALPFIWAGTVLCVKRLRNTGLPTWLVILFFVPFINLLLFLLLAAIPARIRHAGGQIPLLERVIPKSKTGSALFAVGLVAAVSLVLTALLVNSLNDYGWSVFVGIPFFLGFGSVLLYGHNRRITFGDAMTVALIAISFFSLVIFILAFEGLICIIMAFPIFITVAFIGAVIGFTIANSRPSVSLNIFAVPVVALCVTGVVEHQIDATPPTINVVTTITINATKQNVWDEVVAFSEIDEPTELLFKTGIAYPTHAEIDRTGVGAIRKCNFTTGCFIEPITVWDEPHLLEFSVLDQPPPMLEWSIYNDLDIPHLDGYFKSVRGQFKLEELPNGQTLLTGTTWYHHNVWPTAYWKLWSDYILHKIHMRVLRHIRDKVEEGGV